MHVHAPVFKAYDIRGIVGETVDETFAEHLGRAFGTEALAAGERAVAVGRDGRLSGPALSAALRRGLASTGLDVVDLGAVTTPMLYYVAATRAKHGCSSGIEVTGSHNPRPPTVQMSSPVPRPSTRRLQRLARHEREDYARARPHQPMAIPPSTRRESRLPAGAADDYRGRLRNAPRPTSPRAARARLPGASLP